MANVKVMMGTNTLLVSKAFFKKAQVFKSPEFNELREAMAMFPAFKVQFAYQASGKRTYKRLTIEQMEAYIRTQPDSEKRLAEFAAVLAVAAVKGSKYPSAKRWFFEHYPDFKVSGVCEDETAELLARGNVVPMPSAEAAAASF